MPSLSLWLQALWKRLTPTNFITIHYTYFILTCLVSAIILWGASIPLYSLSFTDALFLAVSAMSLAGLNTVNLSSLNTFQQFVLFLLIMLGSTIFVSASVVFIRRRAFEKAFTHIVDAQRNTSRSRSRSTILPALSISRSKVTRKTNADMEPEIDGVVVRGRAIPSIRLKSSTSNDVADRNPGNHLRAELHDKQEQHRESTELHSRSPSQKSPQLDRPPIQGNGENEQSGNEKPSEIPSNGPNIRFADQSIKAEAITSPGQGSVRFIEPTTPRRPRLLSMTGVGARPDLMNHPSTAPSISTTASNPPGELDSFLRHFGEKPISRNSQITMLTSSERDKLGGVEYRALRLLEFIVPLYFILFQFFGCIGIGAWIALNTPEVAIDNGLNPWWVGAFNAVSAFNNSGMSLLDANMVAFQSAYYVLITMSLLILAGNTCYPVFLRLVFWVLWKLTPEEWADYEVALRFILKHPRRVYTNLFPASHTWFLLGTVIVLNAVDWVAFEILNIGNPYVESIPANDRVIDGLFQAFAVRSGGFYVVPIGSIAIGVQVLYVLMMYISVYPVTMTIRNSNVYEERSLGIYAQGEESTPPETEFLGPLRRHLTNNTFSAETGTDSRSYFIRQQIRSQLAHDLWWLCLAVLLIVIIEGSQFATDPVSYSVFNIVLEVVSAYGTVGISVGLPGVAYSFCGGWHTLSKLILCGVMLRGRHRGLPVAIDRAVLLPNESLANAEEEDARKKAQGTTMSRSATEAVLNSSSVRRRNIEP